MKTTCTKCNGTGWDDPITANILGFDRLSCDKCNGTGKMTATRPRIVCLCGSTRFYTAFQEANFRETMKGNIVLSVGFYPHAQDEMHGEDVGVTAEQKDALDVLHLHKIDLADEVIILNVGGYIGQSTSRELAYAREQGKAVRFLEPVK